MQKFQQYLKDWRFYFKLIFGLLLAAVLLYHWLNPLIHGITVSDEEKAHARNWIWFTQDKGDYTLNFLSFFTTQTNIMVASWFIFSAIFHDQEGKAKSKWFNNYLTLAIATFITITFIVFNTMLLPTLIHETGFFFWFTNVVEHMIMPIIFVGYFLFFMKKEQGTILTNKLYWKKYMWKYYLYPIIWAIVMLIRGEFRYQAGKAWAYQYFFINIHQTTDGLAGWVWLLIATIFISTTIFVVSTLYNSLCYKKNA